MKTYFLIKKCVNLYFVLGDILKMSIEANLVEHRF